MCNLRLIPFTTCYRGEETASHIAPASPQGTGENEVSPEPPFPQAKQHLPLATPQQICSLQTFYHPHCPSLVALHDLNVLLLVRAQKLTE